MSLYEDFILNKTRPLLYYEEIFKLLSQVLAIRGPKINIITNVLFNKTFLF